MEIGEGHSQRHGRAEPSGWTASARRARSEGTLAPAWLRDLAQRDRKSLSGIRASLPATRVTTLAVVAVGLLLTGAVGLQPASAGTYTMWNCNVPGRGNSPLHPWQAQDTTVPNVAVVDACATGGGVGVTLGDDRQIGGGYNEGIVLPKPTGPHSQIRFVKLVLWYAARLAGSGQSMSFSSGHYQSDRSYQPGLSNAPPGSENLVAEQQLSPDAVSIHMALHCGPLAGVQTQDPCFSAHRVPLLIRGIEVTLSEDVPPNVSQLRGTLLEGGAQSGGRSVEYAASDPQSGLNKVDVLLDDVVVATRNLTTRCSYSGFTVCPESFAETLEVDTRAVPNGRHRLSVRVRDAAGNERTVHGDSPVDVANAAGFEKDSGAYTLSARFRGSSRSTLTVPYGRRVSVHGHLTHRSAPVRGGQIEVLERYHRPGVRDVPAARVDTHAGGSFSVVLATTRPSRTVRLAYRPAGGAQVVSRALKLRVRARARLQASLRGRIVRFRGRVLSRPIPRNGKWVLMEGHAPGSAWTVFKRLHTDRKGRFSGAYRLRVRRPGVRLKIRAVVPSEEGYGYLSSFSRAVRLRVR